MSVQKTVVYILTKLELGGAQKVCLSLLQRVSEQGMRTVLISGREGVLVNQARDISDEVYFLNFLEREVSLTTLWREGVAFFELCWTLYQLKQQYGPLIVHTHSTKAGLMGRWAAWLVGVETIVHTVHGFGFHPYQRIWEWWMHYILEYWTSWITSEYVCVSAQDRHIGAQLLPFFKQRCSLIRAAIDWKQFYRPATTVMPSKKGPFIIGTVACFRPLKNLFDLLEVVRRLKDEAIEVRLEIIGDGELRSAIEEWIELYGMQEQVTLLGWQLSVAPFMKKWQLFAFSSLREGLPCSIVEARLLQIPVVSYDIGAISEVVKHDKNGFLIKPKDVQGLYEAIQQIVLDDTLRSRLAQHHERLNDFNDVIMGTRHLKMYRNIAGE